MALALLAAALLIGLGRFLFLGRWSLWLDEAYTLADARHGEGFLNFLGYWLFGRVYGLVQGRPDELWLRLPAAVCGFLVIPACWWAFRPSFGARASALAALFVAASCWQLYWSQNARFYTLAQLLALVGGGGLLRGLGQNRVGLTVAGLVLLVLAPLAHPSAALLAAPLFFSPWIARWLERFPEPEEEHPWAWRILSLMSLAVVVGGIGWALLVWGTWERRQGLGDPLHFLKTVGYLVTPPLGAAFLWGLVRAPREREGFAPVLSTALALAAALLASFFVRVSAQYVFVVLPWLASVAALPLSSSAALRAGWARGLLVALVVLPGLVESSLYFTQRNGDRPHWREAYRYVFEQRRPGDLVLGMEAPVAEYYLDPATDDLRACQQVTWLDDFRARAALDWARYDRRTWFVVNATQMHDWRPENRADLEQILATDCRLEASFVVPWTPRDLDVLVYLRP
jgi:hypothetical protein